MIEFTKEQRRRAAILKHYGDITKINGAEVEPVSVIIGGSPCQDLSVAGKRAGLAGERSGLFMEQIRIIKEMRDADRQRSNNICGLRPRFMVWENVVGAISSGNPKGADFKAVLEETIKVADPKIPDIPLPKKWALAGCLFDEHGRWSVAWRVFDAQFWGVPQRRRRIALVADFGGLSAPEILFEREGLSGDFAESRKEGQGTAGTVESGIDEAICEGRNGVISFDRAAYNQGQNAQYDFAIDEDVAQTIVAKGPGGVLSERSVEQHAVFDARGNGDGKTVNTITGDHENRITDYSEVAIDNLVVRRLTPMECERLQGFPNGWTDIGDYVDTQGKLRKTSDSARYKALGNSIALPSWAWLLERLSKYVEDEPTMASLFDGIGGFPLIWARINDPENCIWASEIEEFPIAVTKTHFGDEEKGIKGDIEKYLYEQEIKNERQSENERV